MKFDPVNTLREFLKENPQHIQGSSTTPQGAPMLDATGTLAFIKWVIERGIKLPGKATEASRKFEEIAADTVAILDERIQSGEHLK